MEKCEKCKKPLVKDTIEKCIVDLCNSTIEVIEKVKNKVEK